RTPTLSGPAASFSEPRTPGTADPARPHGALGARGPRSGCAAALPGVGLVLRVGLLRRASLLVRGADLMRAGCLGAGRAFEQGGARGVGLGLLGRAGGATRQEGGGGVQVFGGGEQVRVRP